MKIRLSQKQWKQIGKKAGWMKESQEPMGDVWQLESDSQEIASEELAIISQQALSGDESSRQILVDLWDGESWESIEKKLNTEGSVWYVWWMDGVNKWLSQKRNEDI